MPTPPVTEAQVKRVMEKYASMTHLTLTDAAKKLGIGRDSLRRYIRDFAPRYGIEAPQPANPITYAFSRGTRPAIVTPTHEYPEIPDDDLDVEEIIAMRSREFDQKRRHEEASKLLHVKVKVRGPIGIIHMGDPHLDDDGTDIAEAFRVARLSSEVDGLWAANVGDTTNAWVGRLARLYAEQNMGRKRALKVAEHFIKTGRWLYMVGGNHDGWAGEDDPIKWISRQHNVQYRPSEARLELNFPEGESFTINARHDFSGSSMWNPAHGVMKAAQLGVRDELATCGHKHVSGYGILKDPATGNACHALQVGSFKVFDRFAKDKGFRDQHLGPCAVTVIDPMMPRTNPDRCKVFFDVDSGVDYLKFKRRGVK